MSNLISIFKAPLDAINRKVFGWNTVPPTCSVCKQAVTKSKHQAVCGCTEELVPINTIDCEDFWEEDQK